jgi:hypothetical protein
MSEQADKEPRNLDANQRAEREFDVITLVLAGVLAAIVLAAVGYGIFRSSEVATTIPFPTHSSGFAGKATTSSFTEGSGDVDRKSSGRQ